MVEFNWLVRVYYEDTDNGGVVYYANYLKFMERARTEWLRSVGVEQDQLIDKEGIAFVVRSAYVDYLHPAYFNDVLNVVTTIAEQRKVSLTFDQRIFRDATADPESAAESKTICQGKVQVACVDASSFRPRAIPSFIATEILGGH